MRELRAAGRYDLVVQLFAHRASERKKRTKMMPAPPVTMTAQEQYDEDVRLIRCCLAPGQHVWPEAKKVEQSFARIVRERPAAARAQVAELDVAKAWLNLRVEDWRTAIGPYKPEARPLLEPSTSRNQPPYRTNCPAVVQRYVADLEKALDLSHEREALLRCEAAPARITDEMAAEGRIALAGQGTYATRKTIERIFHLMARAGGPTADFAMAAAADRATRDDTNNVSVPRPAWIAMYNAMQAAAGQSCTVPVQELARPTLPASTRDWLLGMRRPGKGHRAKIVYDYVTSLEKDGLVWAAVGTDKLAEAREWMQKISDSHNPLRPGGYTTNHAGLVIEHIRNLENWMPGGALGSATVAAARRWLNDMHWSPEGRSRIDAFFAWVDGLEEKAAEWEEGPDFTQGQLEAVEEWARFESARCGGLVVLNEYLASCKALDILPEKSCFARQEEKVQSAKDALQRMSVALGCQGKK